MPDDEHTPPKLLMKRFQRHLDEDALESLFSRFAGPALSVARATLSDHTRAEDAVQEAFLRLIRKRNQYDASRAFAPWFYTILRNICTDMLRRSMRSLEMTGHEKLLRYGRPGAPSPPHAPVTALMEKLPPGQRVVLELRILHKMRFRSVSAALGISEEAAKKRAQRGLRRLRELYFLNPGGDADEERRPRTERADSGR